MPEYGNSGLSALPAVVASFDRKLIRPVKQKGRPGVKDFVLVSPFCGKREEFQKYLMSLDRLPCQNAFAVFYDNSGDVDFQQQLMDVLERKFDSYLLIEDLNDAVFVDSNVPPSAERMKVITQRIGLVYSIIYEQYVPRDVELVLNLEDDIEIPDNAYHTLVNSLQHNEKIGTVIGTCCDRRIDYGQQGRPIAFGFQYQQRVGHHFPDDIELIPLHARTFGIEAIGSGHMGFWLTRMEALNHCPIGEPELFGINGHDLVWGWRLHEQGYLFANDWSVRCKHWFTQGRRLQCV